MHKTFTDVRVKDADKGLVEAVFSTFGVLDSDGDITLPGAIEDGAEVVISAYGHRSHWGSLPVGKGRIRTTDTEAILEGQFFLDTTAGRETFEVVKELVDDRLGEWSWSLHDVKSHRGDLNGRSVNFIDSVRIKEVSPVLIGASIGTRTLSAKARAALDELEHIRLQHIARDLQLSRLRNEGIR